MISGRGPGHHVERTRSEGDEVARQRTGRREPDRHPSIRTGRAASLRRVGEGAVPGGDGDLHLPGDLERGLVEAGERPPRIDGLEEGVEVRRLALVHLVEAAASLGVERALEVEDELGRPGGQGCGRDDAQEVRRSGGDPGGALGAPLDDGGPADGQVLRVEPEGRGCRGDRELDAHRSGVGRAAWVEAEGDPLRRRSDVGGQPERRSRDRDVGRGQGDRGGWTAAGVGRRGARARGSAGGIGGRRRRGAGGEEAAGEPCEGHPDLPEAPHVRAPGERRSISASTCRRSLSPRPERFTRSRLPRPSSRATSRARASAWAVSSAGRIPSSRQHS